MEKQDSGIRFETFDIGVQRLYIWQQKYGSTSAHYHECIELIHMLKGNITLTADATYHLSAGDTVMDSLVIRAVDYIHAHYHEKLRLSDIADALYCSEQTISAPSAGIIIVHHLK